MTLHRLRRLLGREEAVLLKGRALSLNPSCCRVDVLVFECLAEKAPGSGEMTAKRPKEGAAEAVSLSEKALELYKGPFLPGDTDMDCTVPIREKMRNRALQLASSLGSHREASKHWEKAIECYRGGLEIDPLSSGLGIEPSEKTREVYERLRCRRSA
jgi:LuxR family maltose regulon positive regulatory protein